MKPLKNYPWLLRLLFSYQTKKYGGPLEPTLIWGRSPKLLTSFLRFGKTLERKNSPLPPFLRTLVMVYVSQARDCAFCIDLNTHRLIEISKNEAILAELQNFHETSLFSDKEKTALEYAEKVVEAPNQIPDHLFAKLQSQFSENEIVELTALISFQLLSSTFNASLCISAHGFTTHQPQSIR